MDFQKTGDRGAARLKQLTFCPTPFKYDEIVKSNKMPSRFNDKEFPFFMQMVYFE